MCTEPWSILSSLSIQARPAPLGPVCKENSGFILGLYSGSLGDLLSRILDKEVTIRCVSVVSLKKKGKKRIEVSKPARGEQGRRELSGGSRVGRR